MIQDVKILELNKQHYFDYYNTQMKCDYSCWGYYDGLKIVDAPIKKNSLFEKKTNAPISPIWFGMGEGIEGLEGKFSKQNIGIFRDPNEDLAISTEFWGDVFGKSPYFAVVFIQLFDKKMFADTAKEIEKLSYGSNPKKEEYRKLLTYFTFDNAEIIGLIKTNSLQLLGETISEIEKNQEISYVHSIMGVSEEYLESCVKGEQILKIWNGIDCHVEDTVDEVLVKVVTSGQTDTIGKIKTILQEQCLLEEGDITYSRLSGHGSMVLQLPDIMVKDVIRMMYPDGLLTHSNPLYGKEIYNIETELFLHKNNLTTVEGKNVPEKKTFNKKRWCEILIEKYIVKMKTALQNQDEGLYSFYRALVQTLNTLMQYEGFSLSENIFFYLYPAFDMFDTLLEQALEEVKNPSRKCELLLIKESICEFLLAVNSIIYHMIHTDQVFLMVPGYSGSSYSIPLKLCLMYLGIAEDVMDVLNDQNARYACLLTPETEIRPSSAPIDMGIYSENRLIKVKSSQRSLFMPRHFIMILTHEIAHYVGREIRMREKRRENSIKTIACYLAEGIFPEAISKEIDHDIYVQICEKIKGEIKNDCIRFLSNEVKISNVERCDYSEQLKGILTRGCQKYLASNENGIGKYLNKIYHMIKCQDEADILSFSEELYKQREWLNHNRLQLLHSGVMEYFVENTLKLYQEIFSDVAAMEILKCDVDTFKETWEVSEGLKVSMQENRNDLFCARQAILEKVFEPKKNEQEDTDTEQEEMLELPENWPLNYHNEFYTYIWLEKYLVEYAMECKEHVSKRIEKEEIQEQLKEIRNIFSIFSGGKNSCCEIYGSIMECIDKYIQKTKNDYITKKKD